MHKGLYDDFYTFPAGKGQILYNVDSVDKYLLKYTLDKDSAKVIKYIIY